METIFFNHDIFIMYVEATSFPEGIQAAHEKLHSIVPYNQNRKYLGISRPENGIIKYKACAEVHNQDDQNFYGLQTMKLNKGKYISTTVVGYPKRLNELEGIFQELLAVPGIDPEGYCVEWYLNQNDMMCLVRLAD